MRNGPLTILTDAMKEKKMIIMKRILYYLLIAIFFVLSSCKQNLPGFDFQSFRETPVSELAVAVQKENLKQIERLVKIEKVPIDYLDPEFGHSLLMLAIANSLQNSTTKLLELGANPNLRSDISQIQDSSYIDTPMFIACDNTLNQNSCDTSLLKSIIKYGGNVNDKIQIKYIGANYTVYDSPLLKACSGGCLKILKLLVNSGADINMYDYKEGTGPISASIIHDRMEILRYLIIERGAVIPEYCYVVHAHNETSRKTYTVTEFLLKRKYKNGSTEDNIRTEILEHLKSRNLS
jgi:ankyrin repeat protein